MNGNELEKEIEKVDDLKRLEHKLAPEIGLVEELVVNDKEEIIINMKDLKPSSSEKKGLQKVRKQKYSFVNGWCLGEGNFRWPGRDSAHDNPVSYVEVRYDSDKTRIKFYVYQFTNLNNFYWAKVGYRIKLYANGNFIKSEDVYILKVQDEDHGDEPTSGKISQEIEYSPIIDQIKVYRLVGWSRREPDGLSSGFRFWSGAVIDCQ